MPEKATGRTYNVKRGGSLAEREQSRRSVPVPEGGRQGAAKIGRASFAFGLYWHSVPTDDLQFQPDKQLAKGLTSDVYCIPKAGPRPYTQVGYGRREAGHTAGQYAAAQTALAETQARSWFGAFELPGEAGDPRAWWLISVRDNNLEPEQDVVATSVGQVLTWLENRIPVAQWDEALFSSSIPGLAAGTAVHLERVAHRVVDLEDLLSHPKAKLRRLQDHGRGKRLLLMGAMVAALAVAGIFAWDEFYPGNEVVREVRKAADPTPLPPPPPPPPWETAMAGADAIALCRRAIEPELSLVIPGWLAGQIVCDASKLSTAAASNQAAVIATGSWNRARLGVVTGSGRDALAIVRTAGLVGSYDLGKQGEVITVQSAAARRRSSYRAAGSPTYTWQTAAGEFFGLAQAANEQIRLSNVAPPREEAAGPNGQKPVEGPPFHPHLELTVESAIDARHWIPFLDRPGFILKSVVWDTLAQKWRLTGSLYTAVNAGAAQPVRSVPAAKPAPTAAASVPPTLSSLSKVSP